MFKLVVKQSTKGMNNPSHLSQPSFAQPNRGLDGVLMLHIKTYQYLLFILLMFSSCTEGKIGGRGLEMSESAEEISNEDVEWDGNYVGLSPTLTGDSAKRLLDLGEQAIPKVLAALSDPDMFVVAHVILTQLSGVDYQALPAWNGLVVDLAQDGSANINPDQRFDLVRRWQTWYDTKPRPNFLPPVD